MSDQYVQNRQNEIKPDNLLVWSILTTVFCCFPLGIVAIVQSNKVDTLWALRDKKGAYNAAKQAKLFCLISSSLGVLVYIIAIFTGVLSILLEM